MKQQNWYQRSMPTVADVSPHVQRLADEIKAIRGVRKVHAFGSYVANLEHPAYPIKDLDLIAETEFDSGDLMAIDAGHGSPMKMVASELEDYGFNPKAVAFTKKFTAIKEHQISHWATSSDGKVLHWGPMPESRDDWEEAHANAETYASEMTGYNRLKLAKTDEDVRREWYEAFRYSLAKAVGKKNKLGWYPCDRIAEEMLLAAKLLAQD